MTRRKQSDEYAETHILDGFIDMPEADPDATAVLDDEYLRQLEAEEHGESRERHRR